jgi:hypothetical protein
VSVIKLDVSIARKLLMFSIQTKPPPLTAMTTTLKQASRRLAARYSPPTAPMHLACGERGATHQERLILAQMAENK